MAVVGKVSLQQVWALIQTQIREKQENYTRSFWALDVQQFH